ncbi:hypothetical protein QBC46DRAFT_401101 [Diplogelasinospora grovesii]|uniref:Uncharacterized protein n=1 Tax=Diplogelasinospora grovesii TaxID=303347 RepID=A0AAN6RYG4_9PEZI|nr:hypothetical protein QBC46DRAFT_401101 [Diplogelasinospora grovesii]
MDKIIDEKLSTVTDEPTKVNYLSAKDLLADRASKVPLNESLKQADFTRAGAVLAYVFSDAEDWNEADREKQKSLRSLSHLTLPVLAALLRKRDIRRHSKGIIGVICEIASDIANLSPQWSREPKLREACLAVDSNSEVYLRFRAALFTKPADSGDPPEQPHSDTTPSTASTNPKDGATAPPVDSSDLSIAPPSRKRPRTTSPPDEHDDAATPPNLSGDGIPSHPPGVMPTEAQPPNTSTTRSSPPGATTDTTIQLTGSTNSEQEQPPRRQWDMGSMMLSCLVTISRGKDLHEIAAIIGAVGDSIELMLQERGNYRSAPMGDGEKKFCIIIRAKTKYWPPHRPPSFQLPSLKVADIVANCGRIISFHMPKHGGVTLAYAGHAGLEIQWVEGSSLDYLGGQAWTLYHCVLKLIDVL